MGKQLPTKSEMCGLADLTVFYMGRYTVSGSGADCKSAVNDSGGSTPSLPTINQKYSKLVTGYKILKNRCAIWAEVKGPPRVEILYKIESHSL